MKIGEIVCISRTQKNSRTLRPMDGISYYNILIYLDCTKHHEINMHFLDTQKHNQQTVA